MSINLTKCKPKLNVMYGNLDMSINFIVIDFIYGYLIEQHGKTREELDEKLYELLGIGETNYHNFVNCKRNEPLKYEMGYNNQHAYKMSEGIVKLEIDGISRKQWRRYIDMRKRYQRLRDKNSYDRKTFAAEDCDRAGVQAKEIINRYKKYKKYIHNKIKNKEMNRAACDFYELLERGLFVSKECSDYRKIADSWVKNISMMSSGNLYGLWKTDRNRYNELLQILQSKVVEMKKLKTE